MVFLPQHDPNPNSRVTQQDIYEYDYSKLPGWPQANVPGLPMLRQIPPEAQSFSRGGWVKYVVSLLLRLQANRGLQDLENFGKFRRAFIYLFLSLAIADPKRESKLKKLFNFLLSVVRFGIKVVNLFRRRNPLPSDPQQIVDQTRVENLAKSFAEPEQAVKRYEDSTSPSAELTQVQASPIPANQQSFDDYRPKLQGFSNLFQIVYLPEISRYFQLDRAFAAQRVAGMNPLVIERVNQQLPANFPLSELQYQSVMGTGDSLAQAISDGRLYIADYRDLANMTPGQFPNETDAKGQPIRKYVYAPMALFAVPATGTHRSLVPVAIQCGQDPQHHPIFTQPPAQTPQAQQWDWLIAKTIVQIADGNYHELISHLGRTHLFLESLAISTPRQLATNHPLYVLLNPHFFGTLFINDSALTGLVNDKGTVDAILFATIEDSRKLSVRGAKGFPYSFNDSMLPVILKARGVEDVSKLPDYPYRDDALLIWEATHDWVSSYLSLYYHSNDDIQKDTELQHWCKELTAATGGQMVGFGEVDPNDPAGEPCIYTRDYLIDAVTLIIFTASTQHATVNFPQATYLTYTPNMPLAGYQPAPNQSGATFADYLALLPSLAQAETQLNMTYVLGSVYYSKLGDYIPPEGSTSYFTDAQVAPLLAQFQQRLQEIEQIIEARNAVRPTYYDTLLPNKIPQSINI
jgi:arachidonate 15-lipoxygenase